MNELPDIIERLNLPSSLLLIVAFGFSVYSGVRMLAERYAQVAAILGPLGQRWTQAKAARIAKAINAAELERENVELKATKTEQAREIAWLRKMRDDNAWTSDLSQQIRELAAIVKRLRLRAQLCDAYLVYDAEWHRRAILAWNSEEGRDVIEQEVPEHENFLDFERRWFAERAGQTLE